MSMPIHSSTGKDPHSLLPTDLARLIDHTCLRATASDAELLQVCKEAVENQFYAVCVNGSRVPMVAEALKSLTVQRGLESQPKTVIAAVVGFPLGQSSSRTKSFEAADAIENGASEIDMVMRLDCVLSGDFRAVERDISAVVSAASSSAIVKVILETCFLTDEQVIESSKASEAAGAHFVKTSTGFAVPPEGKVAGATIEHILLMRKATGGRLGVKASGGIKSREFALQLIEAGATRLGTSASVDVIRSEGGRKVASDSSATGGSY